MKIYKILSVLLLLSSATFAQTEMIPNTNAGNKLSTLLNALSSGNYEDLMMNHVSKSSFTEVPRGEQERFIEMVNRMHGGFSFHSVVKSSENEIHALVKSINKADTYRLVVLETEDSPPHKIKFWDIQTADPPSEGMEDNDPMTEGEILEWVDKELKKLTEEEKFSGSFLIAKNGKPIFKNAYGLASREFNVPNKIDTKFNIGSINKAFTQVAIAQLLEQGKIALDDNIGKYINGFPENIAEKVTIKNLLLFTSGMSHYWVDEYWQKYLQIKTVSDLMEIIKKQPLDFEPGTDQQYSNSGYVVLGAIIEKVTGMDYYNYIRKYVYQPADMTNTDCYDLEQIIPNLATGYYPNQLPNPYMNNKFQNNIYQRAIVGSPAGGGYSTAEDLNKFVEALKSNKLASERYTNLAIGSFENLSNPEKRPSGFFFGGGGSHGINSTIEADFESGYTVIALTNYPPPAAEIAIRTLDKLGKQVN